MGDDADPGWPSSAVVLAQPTALRALAHPARLAVVEVLFGRRVDRTATELAAVAGSTPSAMSYHLRALERHGIVTRSPAGGDGRERRWRAAGDALRIDDTARGRTAAGEDLVVSLALEPTTRHYLAWRRAVAGGRPDPGAGTVTSGTLFLTRDQARDLSAAVQALLGALPRHDDDAEPGAFAHRFLWAAFPDVTDPDATDRDSTDRNGETPSAGGVATVPV